MTIYVLDASVTMAWCFDNEASSATDRLLEQLEDETAAVPASWHLEVANVLALSERRGRITQARSAQFVEMLRGFEVATDQETAVQAWGKILDLARNERLTTYDAAYLELAMRLGVPLATKDRELGEAAERVGVQVLWGT